MEAPTAPARTPDGKFNVEWFAEVMVLLNRFQQDHWNWWGRAWPEYDDQVKQLISQATACGINLKAYAPDNLSVTDIARLDDLFGIADEQIDRIMAQINGAAGRALEMLPDVKKKSWLSVLRRIKILHEMCRDETPAPVLKALAGNEDAIEAWRLIHPLRFMLYCQRTTLNQRGGEEALVDCPAHIVRAVLTLSLAQRFRDEGRDIRGALVTIPPRHGKSWLMQARRALRMSMDPWSPFGIVHANKDIAAQRVVGVKQWFDDNRGVGRRRAALFPRVRLHKRKSKAESIIVLTLDGEESCTHTEGNLSAHGMHETAQGITQIELDFDDPVDEKERRERGSRERTNAAFHQTWLNRLTGKRSFFTLISTCWHPDDVTGGLVKMVRNGAMRVAMCNLPCGGPDEKFRPLWPEAGLDEMFLLGKYRTLGPPVYACIYQNNPDDIAGRKISRLCFYDRDQWHEPSKRTEQWRRFFESPATQHMLSVDPAGSSNKNSNRAGIMHLAFGPMDVTREDGSIDRVPRLVAVKAWSMNLSQHGLSDTIVAYHGTPGVRIDRILVETTGGYHATSEELIRNGIPAAKVVTIPPGQGTKVSKLMRYAIFVEKGDIVFPGTWSTDDHGDPCLVLDSDFDRVGDQLLMAGMSDDDEMLDVVRQALGDVAHEFVASHGWDSSKSPSRQRSDPQQVALDRYYRSIAEAQKRKANLPRRGRGLVAFANRKFTA